MEVRNLCDRAGTEELGPGAGRNGENPWDLLAAHAGSVGESPSESAFIGHLLLMLPVGERPELPWSTLLCGSSVVGWATTCVLCAPVLLCSCAVCCVLSHGEDEALLSMKSHSYFGRRLCWSATYKQLFEPAL